MLLEHVLCGTKNKEKISQILWIGQNLIYRVSLKTVATFIFGISRLPMVLKIPSWTFLKSLFCVDLKNIRFFYCLMKSTLRYFQNTSGKAMKKLIVETTT